MAESRRSVSCHPRSVQCGSRAGVAILQLQEAHGVTGAAQQSTSSIGRASKAEGALHHVESER